MKPNPKITPKVGLQVLVVKDKKILIGLDTQKGPSGVYGVPGGDWENGETLEEGAIREVFEESGIVCGNLKFMNVFDFYREDKGVSYVSIGYTADYKTGELTENNKEGRLDWKWLEPYSALKIKDLYPAGRILIEDYLKTLKHDK